MRYKTLLSAAGVTHKKIKERKINAQPLPSWLTLVMWNHSVNTHLLRSNSVSHTVLGTEFMDVVRAFLELTEWVKPAQNSIKWNMKKHHKRGTKNGKCLKENEITSGHEIRKRFIERMTHEITPEGRSRVGAVECGIDVETRVGKLKSVIRECR